ncbi:hypothetical protein FB451DRAFT_1262639 [Mycena latifolia]|nr:hypothetical protein FB451DRAFT_1262639 [Mycena latifolia]
MALSTAPVMTSSDWDERAHEPRVEAAVYERLDESWKTYTRPDGGEYYVKPGPQANTDFHPTLVFDGLRLRATAEQILQRDIIFQLPCEDVHVVSDESYWIISHKYQISFKRRANLQLPKEMDLPDIDVQPTDKMRRDYWKYMSSHPAHAPLTIVALPDAHRLALTYLKWCSSEALLTSSSPDVPFPYKHSQDLAGILESLYHEHNEMSWPLNNAQAKPVTTASHKQPDSPKMVPAVMPAIASTKDDEIQTVPIHTPRTEPQTLPKKMQWIATAKSEYESRVGKIQEVEVPARESHKLWTSLVAKVLVAKYGQQAAAAADRGALEKSIPTPTADFLFRFLDIASFGSFFRYLGRLEELRKLLSSDDQWKSHILRLVREWEEFNLISTVLLTASAGILALQNLGAVPRTAILVSIISSFGGITTGLYCISKYQLRSPESSDSIERPSNILRFNYSHYAFTHRQIALVLGLPMALLVWSLISFLVGILAFTILDTETNGHVSNVAFGIIAVAGVVLVLMFLAMWNLSKLWATEELPSMSCRVQAFIESWPGMDRVLELWRRWGLIRTDVEETDQGRPRPLDLERSWRM